jgi:hypothetical protein
MKRIIFASFSVIASATSAMAQLETAATADIIWNGVTATADKRIFFCFHRLEDRVGEYQNIIHLQQMKKQYGQKGIS